jgi:hypothetical protein
MVLFAFAPAGLEKPREIQVLPCLQSQHKSAVLSISAALGTAEVGAGFDGRPAARH